LRQLLSFLLLICACSAKQVPSFDGDRAYADLVAQCQFGPRAPNTQAHDKAADFLYQSLTATADICRRQPFTYYDTLNDVRMNLVNIIASYNSENQHRILLCAHWDSRPRAEKEPDSLRRNEPIIGANDGASGAAILLELGRIFKANPPPIGVDIVLFDGEDYGFNGREEGWFLGSYYFARHLGGYRPRAAILLDMVGDKNLNIYREAYSDKYAGDLNNYIWQIAKEKGISAFIDSLKHAVSDDHVPLLSAGLKAIDLIDFDYPYWHTQSDTPDKCSAASLKAVGDVISAAVYDQRISKF
jgi:glutaminyl-peptide cyclotransferase